MMNSSTMKQCVVAGIAALMVMSAVEPAQAAKIPIVYNSGDDIFDAGDGSIPAPFNEEPTLAGAQAGYRCDVFGFFGAYFTISDCEPVAFKGDTYWNAPELAKAVGAAHGPDTMQVGFWKKHGRIPLGLVILALVGFGIWGQIGGKDDDDEDEQPEAAA